MDGQVHTIPDDTAAHYERLIIEAEKMRQAGADALKDAYRDLRSDLKAIGWLGPVIAAEVAAFKGAIAEMALAEADKTKREEKGERVDDYVSLLTRARARGQRKNNERFGPLTGEFVDDEEAEERRSDAGLSIVTKHTEITSSGGSSSAPSSLTTREAEASVVPHSPETANEREAVATICEATVSPQPKDVSLPADGESSEGASAGGIDVDRSGSPATHLVTGEGTALSALPDNSGVVMEDVPEMPMKRPAFISFFPELPNAEYARLREEIRDRSICEPIIRQGDVIVDGWERFLISRELGFDYPIIAYTGTDVILDVIEMQRVSRNFTPAQEKKIAADLAKEFPRRADEIMAAFGLVEALEAAE